jgi:hypothetical protein
MASSTCPLSPGKTRGEETFTATSTCSLSPGFAGGEGWGEGVHAMRQRAVCYRDGAATPNCSTT